jgi:nitric oxide reductase large subunit
MRVIIAGVALWATLSVTIAEGGTILGNGSYSCGDWTAEHQKQDNVTQGDNAWLAGYLSGYSAYNGDGVDVIKNLNAGAREAWVSNYCQTHPLDGIYTAADQLILELKRRASQRFIEH